jgi:hypothetical protein
MLVLRRSALLFLIGAALVGSAGCATVPRTPVGAATTFAELGTLVGRWRRADKPPEAFHIDYELIAKDSVLVETWYVRGAKHSITVFHLDGSDLMATHYCPQGNQPRLVMNGEAKGDVVRFIYLDATNLVDPGAAHQHALGFDLSRAATGTLTRFETYVSADGEEPDELVLTRLDAPPRLKD